MASVDAITAADDDIVTNPDVEEIAVNVDYGDEIQTVPRTLQPLMSRTAWLPAQVQRALQSADAQSFMFGGLTKHEVAAIYLLLRRNSPPSQCFYHVLQQNLLSNDIKCIRPFLPYLNLAMAAVQKLPQISGNIWYIVPRDVTELYPRGHVFTWRGFVGCFYSLEALELACKEPVEGKTTLFNILPASGRIVRQFCDTDSMPQVLVLPGAFFQVVSVSRYGSNSTVIHLKEILPPRGGESLVAGRTASPTTVIHNYWAEALADSTTTCVVTCALRIIDIALAVGDITLLVACLERLAVMENLDCSTPEKSKLLSAVVTVMKMYTAFGILQTHGCALLELLVRSDEALGGSIGSESVTLVLKAMQRHMSSQLLILHGLNVFSHCGPRLKDISMGHSLVEIVLSSMKRHREAKDVQLSGCVVLDWLAKSSRFVSVIKESDGLSVIRNSIRLHRGQEKASEIVWRVLLNLENNTNNNNNCSSGLSIREYKDIDFLALVKEGMKMFSKNTQVQEEGLHALWSSIQGASEDKPNDDSGYLELAISALRYHNKNAMVVECACGILSELTKSSSHTHLAVDDGAIECVLTAMNQHFNAASVQEYGCNVLRTIAMNGCRPDQIDSGNTETTVTLTDTPLNKSALPDYRLKIAESGGIEIVLSAMKTHSQHIGVQRQGCLAVRTLCVSAGNVVETKGIKEISTVLGALSKHISSNKLVTAALRALVILTINPLNKKTMKQNQGVAIALTAVLSFPNCVKIQEEGLAIIDSLADDTPSASELLNRGFIRDIISTIDRYPQKARILTSCCSLLAKLCSVHLPITDLYDMLPAMAVTERGGFDKIHDIMCNFLLDTSVQIKGMCALSALASPPVSANMLPESVGWVSVVAAMKSHSANIPLLEQACKTMNSLAKFQDPSDPQIPQEAVDQILGILTSYPKEKSLQEESLKTLDAMLSKDASKVAYITNYGILSPTIAAMREFPSERPVNIAAVNLLNGLLLSEVTRSPWQNFVALIIRKDRPLWTKFYTIGGLQCLLETMREHMSCREIVVRGGNILINGTVFSPRKVKEIRELSEDIMSCYSPEDKDVRVLFSVFND